MTSTEDVYVAFTAALQRMVTAGKAKKVSRTWYSTADSNPKQEPAILISQVGRRHAPVKGQPPARTLLPVLTVYIPKPDKTQFVVGPVNNQFLDDLEAIAFTPDPVTGVCDLGGLVSHCFIDGEIIEDEVSLERTSILYIPVSIMLKQDAAYATTGQQYFFDTAEVFLTPMRLQDVQAPANPTPVRVGGLSEVTVELSQDHVQIGSQKQMSFAVTSSRLGVHTRSRFATFDGRLLDQMALGMAASVGADLAVPRAPFTVPANPGPYVITVVPPSGAVRQDLGVYNATTGAPLLIVPALTGAGQYMVTAPGTYQFHATDAGLLVQISYLYRSAGGTRLDMTNPWKGLAQLFSLVMSGGYNGKAMTMTLDRNYTSRIAIPTLLERFAILEMEFDAIGSPAGTIGSLSMG